MKTAFDSKYATNYARKALRHSRGIRCDQTAHDIAQEAALIWWSSDRTLTTLQSVRKAWRKWRHDNREADVGSPTRAKNPLTRYAHRCHGAHSIAQVSCIREVRERVNDLIRDGMDASLKTIIRYYASGASGADCAAALGVSAARVSQLTAKLRDRLPLSALRERERGEALPPVRPAAPTVTRAPDTHRPALAYSPEMVDVYPVSDEECARREVASALRVDTRITVLASASGIFPPAPDVLARIWRGMAQRRAAGWILTAGEGI